MYRIGGFKNGVVIILTSSDDVRYAVIKKGRVKKTDVCPFDKLSQLKSKYKLNRAVVGFLSELTYFDRTTFRIKNKKFLKLAIRRYLNEQAVFAEDFDFRFSIVNMRDVADVFICGVPKSDLHRIEAIKRFFVVEAVMPVEIAVLNYCKKATNAEEAVFVYDNLRVDLATEDGVISSRRLSPYEEEELGGENRCILKDNEIFVALCNIDKNFDFLDADYINKNLSYELSKVALFVSVFFAVVVLLFAYQKYSSYKNLKSQFDQKMAFYKSLNSYVNSSIPSEEEKENLKKIDQLIKLENKQLDLPKLLNFITAIIPQPFKLEELGVSKNAQKSSNSNPYSQANNNALQSSDQYSIKLLLTCNCSYKKSKELVKEFMGELTKKVKQPKADLNYTDEENMAILKASFKVEGEKF
ncbi:hypothetical protein [Hippea jasoniae]|uniref:hypothetical protein n=1 Tax=Hippea jasoniae TaxID=944479 RepID=UPI000554FB0B|nr:hypothetical protein [Hippea jasoniae]